MTQTEALTSEVFVKSHLTVVKSHSAEKGGGGGHNNYEPLLLAVQKKDLPLHVGIG